VPDEIPDVTVRDSGLAVRIVEEKVYGVAFCGEPPAQFELVITPFVAVGSVAKQNLTAEIFDPFALTVPFKTAEVPVTEVAGWVCTIGAPVWKLKTAP
jgi:hypothetical protein